jgi:hypothetical protein
MYRPSNIFYILLIVLSKIFHDLITYYRLISIPALIFIILIKYVRIYPTHIISDTLFIL